jgi:hypothetical protein
VCVKQLLSSRGYLNTKTFMKLTNSTRSFAKILSIIGLASALMVTAASAQISIDEWGGTIGLPAGSGALGPDPSLPAGIGLPGPVLVYSLPFGVLGGDVLLADAGTNGALVPSDVIRFWNPANDPTKSFLIFYSDRPELGEIPPPADTGLPPQLQPFVMGPFLETGTEAFNFYDYLAGPGMPGTPLIAAGTPIMYHIISDGQVPEPSTGALFLMAGGLGLFFKRRSALDKRKKETIRH